MLDVFLVSVLVRRKDEYDHHATLKRAGSGEEAARESITDFEKDGWIVTSAKAVKAKLGWYREDGK